MKNNKRGGSRTYLTDVAVKYFQLLHRHYDDNRAREYFRRAYARSVAIRNGKSTPQQMRSDAEIIDPRVLAQAVEFVERVRIARLKLDLELLMAEVGDE